MYYNDKHILKAKQIALNNNHDYHLAAMLYRKKKLVKIGKNSYKTHPRFLREYKNGKLGGHLHAEMDVLRYAEPGDVIVVARWKANGDVSMSKPCKYCEHFIREAGIEKVIYTDWDGDFRVMNLS